MERKHAIYLHNILPNDVMEVIDNHLVRMLPDTIIGTAVRHEIEDKAELLAMKRYISVFAPYQVQYTAPLLWSAVHYADWLCFIYFSLAHKHVP